SFKNPVVGDPLNHGVEVRYPAVQHTPEHSEMRSSLGAESQEGIREVTDHRTQARHQLARLSEQCVDLANTAVGRCRVRGRLEHVDSAPSNPVQPAFKLRESLLNLPHGRGSPLAECGGDRLLQSLYLVAENGGSVLDSLETKDDRTGSSAYRGECRRDGQQ